MSDENLTVRFKYGDQEAETTLAGLHDATERMARSYGRPSADPLPAGLQPRELYPVPAARRFVEVEYLEAPDLEELAHRLIASFDELQHVAPFRVRYLWKKKGTSTAMGKCTKASGFWRTLADVDFVIWLGAEDARLFSREQVEALLYHELCHVGVGEHGEPSLREHDAETFFAEFRRFGIWRRDYQAFGQLALDGDLERGEGLMRARFDCCAECGEPKEVDAVCPACGVVPMKVARQEDARA